MNFTSLKMFLCRNDVKILVICTITGGVLQIISKQYLESHPELLEDEDVTKEAPVTTDAPGTEDAPITKGKSKSGRPKLPFPPSGALIEVTGVSIKIAQVALTFLAKNGLLAGVITGSGVILSKIPATAISTYVRDAFPQNLPDLEKKKLILVNGQKIFLDQCDQNLEYLFKILNDPTMPFEEKQKIARSILTKYLDLKTMNGRVTFVMCIVLVLYILSIQTPSGYYILLKNLINAIKEGKISKIVGRAIVRKLQKKGISIDPELLEIVDS